LIDEPLRIDRVPKDRVRQTSVSDGQLSGVVVGQSPFIDDIGSQPAGVDEMANAAGARRVTTLWCCRIRSPKSELGAEMNSSRSAPVNESPRLSGSS
jgi:hypothetical protein